MKNEREKVSFASPQDWANAISEHASGKNRFVREGCKIFFNTVLNLPNLESQPQKHWSDYEEGEINFVEIDFEESRLIDPREEELLSYVAKILGYWPPLRFAVFDVRDDKSEVHKGVHRHSAKIVVGSVLREMFQEKVVLHLGYEHNRENYCALSVKHTTFGLSGERKEKAEKMSDLDLLIVANSLAELYAQRVNSPEVLAGQEMSETPQQVG